MCPRAKKIEFKFSKIQLIINIRIIMIVNWIGKVKEKSQLTLCICVFVVTSCIDGWITVIEWLLIMQIPFLYFTNIKWVGEVRDLHGPAGPGSRTGLGAWACGLTMSMVVGRSRAGPKKISNVFNFFLLQLEIFSLNSTILY